MIAPLLHLGWSEWLAVFLHFIMVSVLSVGGAVSAIPEMHRYLVERQHLMLDSQFNGAIAIAQSAPGPNILFVALLGWNVGLNGGSMQQGFIGMAVILGAMMLPSSLLTFAATRWLHRNRKRLAVRAFKQGMSPIVIALLLATAWVLASVNDNPATDWPIWLLTVGTVLVVWLTRVHILWVLTVGAFLGWNHLI